MSEALKLTILVHKPYETRRRKISAPSVTTVDEAIMDAILLASSLVASTRQDMKLSVSMVSKKHIAGYPSVRFHMAPEQTQST